MFLQQTKRTVLLALLMVVAVVMAACGDKKNEAATADKDEELKKITFSWSGDIGDLNPHTYMPNEFFSQAMVYESLVYYGEGGELQPALAESWEVSEDGKTYTFHLRENVKFSDGSPFNAEVAKKNFDTILANRQQHEWVELIHQFEDTEVVDEHTLKMTLKNAYYPALQELTYIRPFRFVAETAFPESGDTFKDGLVEPIGTGPWVLKEHKKDQYATFVRNDHYWGEKPKLDEVTVKVMTDGESRVLAFEKGELDLIFGNGVISQDSFQFLKDSGKYETKLSEPTSTRMIMMNTQKEATKDKDVRLALNHAFNKEAVIENIFYNTEKQADTLFPKNIPYADVDLQPYTYNLEQAKTLLDKAGWKEVKGKEFRQKDGKELTLDFLIMSTDNVQKSVAEYMQGDYRKLGVNVNLISQETNTFWEKGFAGDYDMIFTYTWAVPFDPHSYLAAMTTPSDNGGPDYTAQLGLANKADIDAKIKQVLVTIGEQERTKLYASILTDLHDTAMYIPVSHISNIAVYHKNLTGVEFLPQQEEVPLNKIDLQ